MVRGRDVDSREILTFVIDILLTFAAKEMAPV
jgi:hypothetical protein